MLKKSWTVAAPIALRNSSFLVMCPSDTRVLVTVVPILAPMMMGIAFLSVRKPEATRPTVMDVVVEELWIMLVTRIPIRRLANGLDVV